MVSLPQYVSCESCQSGVEVTRQVGGRFVHQLCISKDIQALTQNKTLKKGDGRGVEVLSICDYHINTRHQPYLFFIRGHLKVKFIYPDLQLVVQTLGYCSF